MNNVKPRFYGSLTLIYFLFWPELYTEHAVGGKDCEAGCQLLLYDLQGRVLGKEMLYSENGKGQLSIDMSRYSNGLYYCSLYGNSQLLQTEKLILMR